LGVDVRIMERLLGVQESNFVEVTMGQYKSQILLRLLWVNTRVKFVEVQFISLWMNFSSHHLKSEGVHCYKRDKIEKTTPCPFNLQLFTFYYYFKALVSKLIDVFGNVLFRLCQSFNFYHDFDFQLILKGQRPPLPPLSSIFTIVNDNIY